MRWRDRLEGKRGIVTALVVTTAWLVSSALAGGIGIVDGLIAAVLLGVGLLRWQTTKPKDDRPGQGIYGPPD
jgi:hypothetical protein